MPLNPTGAVPVSRTESPCPASRQGKRLLLILGLSLVWLWLSAAALNAAIIGKEQEIELCKQVDSQLQKKYGLYQNPEWQKKIDTIGKKIVQACSRQDLPYRFLILNSDQINALSSPDGSIYVTKKLLQLNLNDNELACIIGHEVSHNVKRHVAQSVERSLGFTLLLQLVTKGGTQNALTYQIVDLLLQRGFSRSEELEADRLGVETAYKAGYDPQGMIDFLQYLQKIEPSQENFLTEFFATHPPIPDRIAQLEPQVKALKGGH